MPLSFEWDTNKARTNVTEVFPNAEAVNRSPRAPADILRQRKHQI
jgi:hypothetical protein